MDISNLIKIFDRLTNRGYSNNRVFDDWLDLMIYAFMRDDKHYLEIVNKYNNHQEKGKRDIDLFCNLTGELIVLMEENLKQDVLGELFMLKISHGARGQFFTPTHISECMAELTGNKKDKENPVVNDCCCGSGRLLLAYAKINHKSLFVAQDISPTCVKMTLLNLFLNGLNSYCMIGNPLTGNYSKGWLTDFNSGYPIIKELSNNELIKFKPAIKKLNQEQGLIKWLK